MITNMSQRMGMADARCTDYLSSRLLNDAIIGRFNLQPDDAHKYRMALQASEPISIWPEPTCSIFSYKDTNPVNTNE